jgi:adenosine deaminase
MTPLVDLHRHLEGSIRPATSVELATRIGTDLTSDQWRAALVAADREEGLLPYLAKIDNATALVRTLDDWRRVAVEAVKDVCADGLSALELRSRPSSSRARPGWTPTTSSTRSATRWQAPGSRSKSD